MKTNIDRCKNYCIKKSLTLQLPSILTPDYSNSSVYDFNLEYSTSGSLEFEWRIPGSLDFQWSRLQYRTDFREPWSNGSLLDAEEYTGVIQNLEEFTSYQVQLVIGLTDGEETTSALLELLTCTGGKSGLNCEAGMIISFLLSYFEYDLE